MIQHNRKDATMKKFCPFMSYRAEDRQSKEKLLVDCDENCAMWDSWRSKCGLLSYDRPPSKRESDFLNAQQMRTLRKAQGKDTM